MKYDISTREDIELLVDTFYTKVRSDETIGYFFTKIAAVAWEDHIPIMYDFWSSILINEGQYKGGLIMKHILLDKKSKLEQQHLDKWKELFFETLDELFEGETVDEAKRRAETMGQLMMFKVGRSRGDNFVQ